MVAALVVTYLGLTISKASRVLRESLERVAAEGEIRFSVTRLDRALPTGFETISAPAVFHDAAVFGGRLYVCGPAGLTAYNADGTVETRYHVGLELPPAPLVSVAIGVASDSSGPELWLATAGEGLVAFDGRRFRQVRPEDPEARKLTAVLPLQTGRILIGTEKRGLLVYDGKRIVPFHPSLAGLHVTALAGTDANLWVGTLGRGLLHWQAGRLETFDETSGLPDPQILSLLTDGDGAYAGTALGVAKIRNGRVARVLAQGYFAQSLLKRDATLLVGTLEEGVIETPLEARPGRTGRINAACNGCSIRRMFVQDGHVYLLAGDALYRLDGSAARNVLGSGEALLKDRNISALSVDSAGRLWVGYFDRGLEILEPGITRSAHIEDEHVFCVNRIVQDSEHGLTAVATANGLVMFDAAARQRRVLGKDDGLIANQVTDVAIRPGGGMTIATPAGLTILDAGGASSLYAFHGLVNNHAYALATAGPRTLVGTLGGLSVLDGLTITANFTTANSGLKHNWITAIARVGDDWFVGTYGAGVLRLDSSGRWDTFPDLRVSRPETPSGAGHSEGSPARVPVAIDREKAAGRFEVNNNAMVVTGAAVYAGTLEQGLAVYSRAAGRWSFVTAGLPSANVTALAASGGWIYIGTDNGLVRVQEQVVVR